MANTTTWDQAPKEVGELVERFTRNEQAYKSDAYNEARLRQEFIDPLFEALGWDIANKGGVAEAYKDVIHEDAISIGGATKAPDYCFRIGGTRKFFAEAKKPAINIKQDRDSAFQLRRYAWSSKLPLSVLTNFQAFAVYDCRIKPSQHDPASKARILYLHFTEFLSKWSEIAGVFSRDAVLKGYFDKHLESARGKRGTAEVDNAFLAEIEHWRELLARNVALRNHTLDSRNVNFAVQRTIDRIIFLRICEDRGIERYQRLLDATRAGGIYKQLCVLFQEADERYNSGLFHFYPDNARLELPDTLTLTLHVDDKIPNDIIQGLYYPQSPYEFSVLPADILGQVYERFLGKQIRLTAGHQAKVEEKPEVKKAGGVYYTPTYVVEYIVQRCLAPLVVNKTPREVAKLRIVDPACGSGSFLLGAYQYLLEWHRRYYEQDGPEKHRKHLYQGLGGVWRLTASTRRRILLNNIYGVDIDPQAVEVTKLSLLLKVLEGETEQTITAQLRMFHERALPDLGSNIKCGNSLIRHDFYEQGQMKLLDEEERLRVNAFDWEQEFAPIFAAGGFDAVIGNPPYIFTREQITQGERDYFSTHFKLSWEKHNTFMLFMELLLRILNESGHGGYIVPNSWLTIESGHLLREKYIRRLEAVSDLNYMVFHKVSMEPCIFIVAGKDLESDVDVVRALSKQEFLSAISASPVKVKRAAWGGPGNRITLSSTGVSQVLRKIRRNSVPTGSRFDVKTGLQAYERGKGNPPQTAADVRDHVFDRSKYEDKNSYKYLEGRDIGRYHLSWSGLWMQYGPWLSQPRELGLFTRPRVLLREITAPLPYCLCATFLDGPYLNNKSILNVLHREDSKEQLQALTCILNSRLISVFYKNQAVKSARTIFPKVVIKNLREFPFPKVISDKALQKLAALGAEAVSLRKRLCAAKAIQ